MKKLCVYFLPVFIFSFMLCGCGRNKVMDNDVVNTPVITPAVTVSPTVSPSLNPSMMPDVTDGNVNDTNGIITENDNGVLKDENTVTSSPNPSASTKP